jgi:hypothetical protein
MRMRLAILAAVTVAAALASPAAARDSSAGPGPQLLELTTTTGDGTVSGTADVSVTHEGTGYRVRGYVRDDRGSTGCVTLRAVELHAGTYFSADDIARACRSGQSVRVSAHTGHHYLVLTVVEPWTMNWDGRVTRLN